MTRITKTQLIARVDWVNDALGNDRAPYTMTEDGLRANVGTVTLDWAYGGVRVCRIVGEQGGEADLSPRGTMRQAADYLDAMLTGIRMARGGRN